jgi:molecular chaperone GrpE
MNTDDTQKKPQDATADAASQAEVDDAKDDVTFEDSPDLEAGDDPMEEGAAGEAAIKKLRERAKKAEAERMEYLSGWQRAKADLVNMNKRHDEERKRFAAMGQAQVIDAILPALDSFDMAMSNKEAWEKVDGTWRMGVEYIRTQLSSGLSGFGVTAFGQAGDTFDPALHHSVETVKAESADQDNKIVAVVQKGYRMGEAVIRPATVKVAHLEA